MLQLAKRVIKTELALRRSAMPSAMRRKIRAATHKLNRTNLRGRDRVNFMGHTIEFHGEQAFRHLVQEIFAAGSYYFESGTPRPIIVDCGSNIGMSLIFFKRLYPEARILAFEPDPQTFAVLTRNVSANNLSNVSLHQVAVGSNNATMDFYRDGNDESSSLTMSLNPGRRLNGKKIRVPVRRLSEFLDSPVDLLKLDVEGAEGDVMGDLVRSGALHKIKAIHLEYHHHVGRAAPALSKMLATLEDGGFDYQVTAAPGTSAGAFQDISLYCWRP